jgi:hypothetical protein
LWLKAKMRATLQTASLLALANVGVIFCLPAAENKITPGTSQSLRDRTDEDWFDLDPETKPGPNYGNWAAMAQQTGGW